MALIMALAILKGNPVKVGNLLVPSVFGGVGVIFLVGNYLWSKQIDGDL